MRIIPAIDIIDGKCVRLSQGDYDQKKVYSENPLDIAKSFEDAGLKHLHLVDLDGAKAGKVTNWNVVENLCKNTNLKIDFGGGIKTQEEAEKLFDLGVAQINLGSIAVKNPDLVTKWIETYGSERIILSADVKNEMIAISGWLEAATITLSDFVRDYESRGIRYVTCTDISTDGMLKGPNVELYKKLKTLFPNVNVIASGGVSGMHDLHDLLATGVDGVIVGKAIYEGRVTLEELSLFTKNN